MDNNNFQATNFENQNSQVETQPDIEIPVQASRPKQKNKLMIPFIILLILAVGGLTFGVFEFMQNSSLKTEIADLKAKIEKPETPPKPETPTEKPYSGELKFEYTDEYVPTTTYNVKLDYETGELSVSSDKCGILADGASCSENNESIVLTDKEMKKVWWITREENYDQEELVNALETIAISSEHESDETVNCGKSEEINCRSVDYRATGNSMLDDLLYEIYGEVYCNKMPSSCDSETEECERKYDETTFNCQTAQEVDYPYIENVY